MHVSLTQEDYLEVIWELTRKHGHVRVKDIAVTLGVYSSAVSKMIRKLSQEGILEYEKYQGFRLTQDGYERGRRIHERRKVIEQFFSLVGTDRREISVRAVEELEHHVDESLLECMRHFIDFTERHPDWWQEYQKSTANHTHAGAFKFP